MVGATPHPIEDKHYIEWIEIINVKSFLLKGKISEVVLSQAKEYDPDMIIMGSHGHGPMSQALLGSITMTVLKNTKCPVLIIPSRAKKIE
ncbi:MAG TPA: hypothetical protein DD381_13465 [Lentisphaeria bacterium]|nr:MAG: hypothetical protein A2X47_09935 [Lentisphaerae bacterium GWF2_38_69]HBM17330.1 hypothetical protein [Lentisphaeria bacterium]